MKLKQIAILYILSLPLGVSAQSKYTLENCKELALKNNRQLVNAELQIQASEETRKEAYTKYFPSLSASGLGFMSNKGLLSGDTPPLSFPLSGATLDIPSMPYSLLKKGGMGSLLLTQPLYAGGRIINGNKLASLNKEVNRQRLRQTENQVLLETENLYWTIVSLEEKVKTINALEEQLYSLKKDAEVSLKAGLVTMNDVLQVKLKINELASSRLTIENNIEVCKMNLSRLMGIAGEPTSSFNVVAPDMQHPALPQTLYVNHKEALKARPETNLLDKGVEAAKLQTKIKRGDYLPSVAVGVSYSQNNFLDKWQGNTLGFVSVSVPISGWWGGSHALKKQQMEEEIARNSQLDGQEQLLIQMQNVRNELDNAYKQILIANESIEQSTENLRIYNNQYKSGIVKMSDLLDAQTLFQKSKDLYVDSFADYQKKCVEYMQVTGR